jgi:hypothetical protein
MIVRDSGNPMPMPSDLVVKNGWKTRSRMLLGMPGPESCTLISISRFAASARASMTMRRTSSGTDWTASRYPSSGQQIRRLGGIEAALLTL